MASVTVFTAARMQEIEDGAIVDGDVVGDDLILTKHDGTQVNAGNVRGPQGATGPTGNINGSTGSIDNVVLRSNGTGGATLQNSMVTIDDAGVLEADRIRVTQDPAVATDVVKLSYLEAVMATWEEDAVLSSMNEGSSGVTPARYTFLGGPNVGDRGILTAFGSISFGGTGIVLPNSSSYVLLPSGFEIDPPAGVIDSFYWPVGRAHYRPDGGAAAGTDSVFYTDANIIRVRFGGITSYGTWNSNGYVNYQYEVPAVRV